MTETKERAKAEFRMKADWRESGVSIEGVNLPVTNARLEVRVNEWTIAKVRFAPKQGGTVVEGMFVVDGAEPETAQRIRMTFGPNLVHCHLEIDGRELPVTEMWAEVDVPNETRVGFMRPIQAGPPTWPDYPPVKGAEFPREQEITGYLLAD